MRLARFWLLSRSDASLATFAGTLLCLRNLVKWTASPHAPYAVCRRLFCSLIYIYIYFFKKKLGMLSEIQVHPGLWEKLLWLGISGKSDNWACIDYKNFTWSKRYIWKSYESVLYDAFNCAHILAFVCRSVCRRQKLTWKKWITCTTTFNTSRYPLQISSCSSFNVLMTISCQRLEELALITRCDQLLRQLHILLFLHQVLRADPLTHQPLPLHFVRMVALLLDL